MDINKIGSKKMDFQMNAYIAQVMEVTNKETGEQSYLAYDNDESNEISYDEYQKIIKEAK